MKRYFNRRTLGLAGVLLATQLLGACIILPRPFHPLHRVVVIEGHSAYDGAAQGPHRGQRQ